MLVAFGQNIIVSYFLNVDFLWQDLGSRDMVLQRFAAICSVLQRLTFFESGMLGRNFAPTEPFLTFRDIFNVYASRGFDLSYFVVVLGIPWHV